MNTLNKPRHFSLKILLPLILSVFIQTSKSQSISEYKYIIIQGSNKYNIGYNIGSMFREKGFSVIDGTQEIGFPDEYINNPCIGLICMIDDIFIVSEEIEVNVILKNCTNLILYNKSGTAYSANIRSAYNSAARRAMKGLEGIYSTNSSNSYPIKTENGEILSETEESLIQYYENNVLEEIEGIYKSYQAGFLGYYKIGIKRYGDIYKAIILDTEFSNWNKGEVKAIFEPSSIKGVYSTKWYLKDKSTQETFSLMESPAILEVEILNRTTNTKTSSNFIKLYPPLDKGIKTSTNEIKATGSGFVISTDGIIATNAHVISNSSSIKVSFMDDGNKSTSYVAKVMLMDESNDVALIKIDDENFKKFNEIPYNIVENSEIGEDVFTIGYPLNSIMGSNFKVTNGIVSSNSGIRDDVRYLQISVPIQPGNSGSPLFNKEGNIVGITTAKLNEDAIGQSIENVNYAIKSSYILNIYKMLPEKEEKSINSKLIGKELKDQVKILKQFICLIEVY